MRFLRTNTAIRLTVGPFLDKTDGITPETALTVTNCKLTLMVDDANVPTLVLDTNPTASGGANDMVHVSGDDAGFYDLELAAGNVNYLGRAMLALTDAANHCPVFHEFMILPAMIYDAMVLGTDRLDTNVTHVADTSQTGRDLGASVLISSGSGTGQLDVTSGVIKASLAQILGTAFTEGASGRIAAAFKQFFNIATPAATMDHGVIVDTVTTLTNAPSDSSGVTTLLSRLSALRAGYLDNLSAGAVALASTFSGITSLAQWLGLIAGKQTGNSTARTELRATGAGSGTYDETTDSQEALRDNVGTNGAALSLAKTTNITGFNDLNAAGVRSAVGLASADLDTQLAALPTAGENADAVWEEALGDHSATSGSTAEALAAAGGAGDPWITPLPGSYSAGQAGYIVGTNLDAPVSDVPTANENADALLDRSSAVETGLTVRGAFRLALAALAGKASGLNSTTAVYRNAVADSKDRITATVTADGNRTSVSTDVS